jgi:hypothetical protein
MLLSQAASNIATEAVVSARADGDALLLVTLPPYRERRERRASLQHVWTPQLLKQFFAARR